MVDRLAHLWLRIWRNPRHPKVREERVKALGAMCHNGGLALLIGAGAAPFLNPALQAPAWVRIFFFVLGVALILVGQVLLGYICDEDRRDD